MTGSRQKKSTIVRTFQQLPFIGIRAGFWVTERLAPEVGARWAQRLWFRPPRARTRTVAPPGTPFTVDLAGRTVTGHHWGDGPAVYLMHGWGGIAAQLGALVAPLTAAGYRVVAFDAPGHGASGPGEWGPKQANIPEFAETLSAVVHRHGPAYAVIAHSLGCAATAIAVRDGLAAKRLVFVAPPANPTPYTYTFARRLGFGDRVRRRMVRLVEARVGVPMSYFDVPSLAGEVSVPPTLVIHDVDDPETRFRDGEAIAAAWPESRMMATTGLGHYRVLRDPATIQAVVSFLAE